MLWTIQEMEAWNLFKRTGVLRSVSKHADAISMSAYQWMAEQMRVRIGPAPTIDSLPVWAWYQWEGERKKKPDLRSTGHIPSGTRGVRIEFAINDKQVLLSDFDLWHYVLNYWYLPASEEDGARFEARLDHSNPAFFLTKPLPDPKFHQAVVASWQRIFDMDWRAKDIAGSRAKKSIQATLWELRIERLRSVREFVAR